ncbi:MAG: alanyl-tRNA synthetase [Chitinophagales bacterium]|nr:alanyl-tRNA synthetase [Chitinophagaceae bacterium]MCB9063576.1 alanyl-tRNA synthetase [Chitinophagales bacterium]
MTTALKQNKLITWLKRIGFWGFMFFLAKGLAWLAIGYFVVK